MTTPTTVTRRATRDVWRGVVVVPPPPAAAAAAAARNEGRPPTIMTRPMMRIARARFDDATDDAIGDARR